MRRAMIAAEEPREQTVAELLQSLREEIQAMVAGFGADAEHVPLTMVATVLEWTGLELALAEAQACCEACEARRRRGR